MLQQTIFFSVIKKKTKTREQTTKKKTKKIFDGILQSGLNSKLTIRHFILYIIYDVYYTYMGKHTYNMTSVYCFVPS